jgi:hypothetical protein
MPRSTKRVLLSYYYIQNTGLDVLLAKHFDIPYPDVFLDSGAFSAFSQGVSINVSNYIQYIHRYKHLITVYSNLDVIGSAEGTFANQKRIASEGLYPLPVFHVGEEWSYLSTYIEQYPYIALGGMVPYMKPAKRKALMAWLLKCFRMAQGKAVYHGFGCTVCDIMCALPWYSVDSSTWLTGFRYGEVRLFNAGKIVNVFLGDHASCYKYAHLFRSLGFDPADFANRSRNDRSITGSAAALSFLKAEQWLERRHGPVNIPERAGKNT